MKSEPQRDSTSFHSRRKANGACILTTGTARPFPPPGGLTFSCWFLISRHSMVAEGHPLRFLTLVRHLARTEQPFVCFSVSLCPDDLSLVVSTEEKEFQPLGKVLGTEAGSSPTWKRCCRLSSSWHQSPGAVPSCSSAGGSACSVFTSWLSEPRPVMALRG